MKGIVPYGYINKGRPENRSSFHRRSDLSIII
jgi:hypothetical protein